MREERTGEPTHGVFLCVTNLPCPRCLRFGAAALLAALAASCGDKQGSERPEAAARSVADSMQEFANAAEAGADAPRAPGAASGTLADSSRARGTKQWLEMRRVDLRIDEHAVLHIDRLRGEAIPSRVGEPAVLDDPSSFTVRITSGRVELTGADLGVLLNKFVFGYPGAPLKRLSARTDGTQIILKGVMHKGIDMRFEIASMGSLDPDGRIRLHPTRTTILGTNGMSLMRFFHVRLQNLLDLSKSNGASVEGNDVLLDPTKILPPPAIRGRLASFRVEGDRLVQEFVRLRDDSVFSGYARADSTIPNFVHFRGAELRFGRLLMRDTDLMIVDADPRDPFDLFLAKYQGQLVAGTSRTLANMALEVVMPDYLKVARDGR